MEPSDLQNRKKSSRRQTRGPFSGPDAAKDAKLLGRRNLLTNLYHQARGTGFFQTLPALRPRLRFALQRRLVAVVGRWGVPWISRSYLHSSLLRSRYARGLTYLRSNPGSQ